MLFGRRYDEGEIPTMPHELWEEDMIQNGVFGCGPDEFYDDDDDYYDEDDWDEEYDDNEDW